MSIAGNLRSHAQVTPFYQVRTTQEPVYQAQGAVGGRRQAAAAKPRRGKTHAARRANPRQTSVSGFISHAPPNPIIR
jgi:hypothetical protein